MLLDLNKDETPDKISCDVCIAGAGAAGITIARELAGENLDVVLLESGGFERNSKTEALNHGRASGNLMDENYSTLSRLRYFGGTTNHWNGWCRPLDKIDFQKRDWVPDSGWPISKELLEPYYRLAESVVEINSFDEIDKKQYIKNASGEDGVVPAPYFQFSPPTRFGVKYREELINSDNIKVLINANLTNIRLSENKKSVSQVFIQSLNSRQCNISPRCFILACGALENPRILLNCRDDIQYGLGNQNGVVGKYFMEHPHDGQPGMIIGLDDFKPDSGSFLNHFQQSEINGVRVAAALTLPEKIQQEKKLLNISFQNRNERMLEQGNDDFFYSSVAKLSGLSQQNIDKSKPYVSHLYIRGEQIPHESNRVSLAEDKDALGLQRIKVRYNISTKVVENYRKSLSELSKLLGINYNTRMTIELDDRRDLTLFYHPMGTTRMHEKSEKGVVDKDCKVHGVSNLYVAGSSVFPSSGYANPTLTIVALAIRLAEHLKNRTQHG